MKAIVNYIKEALITKANIKSVSAANKRGDYNIDNITPFPNIDFEDVKNEDAEKFKKWLEENGLMPEIYDIEGHSGDWSTYPGALAGIYIDFVFDGLSYNNELPFLCVHKNRIDVINGKIRIIEDSTIDIIKHNKEIKDQLQRLIDCLRDVLDITDELHGDKSDLK